MGELVTVTVAGIISVLAAWLTIRSQRPKITAESESLAVSTLKEALLLLKAEYKELRLKVDDLEHQMETLVTENQKLTRGNDILRGQIHEMGATPRWPTPPR